MYKYKTMSNFVSCPKCDGNNVEQMSFTWWGGILDPKLLTHVKCNDCGETYNGKTGKDNRTNIIIYSVVVGIIVFALLAVVIGGAITAMVLS